MDEIEFWSEWLGNVEGCERSIKDHLADLFVQVDTGEHTTGGVCKGEAVTIPLPASLIGTSSTLRELHGLKEFICFFCCELRGRNVRFDMDSLPAIRNLINGGVKWMLKIC
eukprot:g49013.t1